jgi:serine/threonine-protein kinase
LGAVRSLKHPNIQRLYDYGIEGKTPYIAIEPVQGSTLRDTLSVRRGGLEPSKTTDVMWQLAKALAYAHDKGIVHGNIIPANIIMRPGGDPLLTGFGLTQALHVQPAVWVSEFLSPEQAGGAPPNPKTDLYSLGVVYYAMATGRTPFVSDSEEDVQQKHLDQPPTPPTQLGANISQQAEAVILWLLAKDPQMRPSAARKILQTLGTDPDEAKYATFALKRSESAKVRQEVRDAVAAQRAATEGTEPPETGDQPSGGILGWLRKLFGGGSDPA